VDAPPFYQHRASVVPTGIRTEVVSVVEERPQIIGGDLKTLLYTTRSRRSRRIRGSRASRTSSSRTMRRLDSRSGRGGALHQILDVARWIRDELDTLGAHGVPKTSGADGLHVYLPLPARNTVRRGAALLPDRGDARRAKHRRWATTGARRARARQTRVH